MFPRLKDILEQLITEFFSPARLVFICLALRLPIMRKFNIESRNREMGTGTR